MRAIIFILSFFPALLWADISGCFYDSVLGQFIVGTQEGQWHRFKVKSDYENHRIDCSEEIAALYDGRALIFWDQNSGFVRTFETEYQSSFAKLMVDKSLAAFYDGRSLFVKKKTAPLLIEKSVARAIPRPLMDVAFDEFAFYDGQDWYLSDGYRIDLYSRLFSSYLAPVQAIVKEGALFYDGLNLHSYCQQKFRVKSDVEMRSRARIVNGGIQIGRSLYSLSSDCKLLKLSGPLPLPL